MGGRPRCSHRTNICINYCKLLALSVRHWRHTWMVLMILIFVHLHHFRMGGRPRCSRRTILCIVFLQAFGPEFQALASYLIDSNDTNICTFTPLSAWKVGLAARAGQLYVFVFYKPLALSVRHWRHTWLIIMILIIVHLHHFRMGGRPRCSHRTIICINYCKPLALSVRHWRHTWMVKMILIFCTFTPLSAWEVGLAAPAGQLYVFIFASLWPWVSGIGVIPDWLKWY